MQKLLENWLRVSGSKLHVSEYENKMALTISRISRCIYIFRIRYTEMRREKYAKTEYIFDVGITKIVVFLSIFELYQRTFLSIDEPYQNRTTGQRSFDFTSDVTVDMLKNAENFGELSHRN